MVSERGDKNLPGGEILVGPLENNDVEVVVKEAANSRWKDLSNMRNIMCTYIVRH